MKIDAHQHFWRYSAAEYGWIEPDWSELRQDRLPQDLAPLLADQNIAGTVAVHPVCSIRDTETAAKLEAVVRAGAENVCVPTSAGCCGFAGDRGFFVPELTAAATRAEAREIRAGSFAGHYSSSRFITIPQVSFGDAVPPVTKTALRIADGFTHDLQNRPFNIQQLGFHYIRTSNDKSAA